MPLESATYISDLDPTNPVGSSDLVSSLDDHMRLVKATLKNTFPGVSGAVTASHTELNHLDGVTGTTGTGKLVLDNAPTIANLTVTGSITLPAESVADSALSDNVPLKNAPNLFTDWQFFQSDRVTLQFIETDASTDEGRWEIAINNGLFALNTLTDAGQFGATAFRVQRLGTAVAEISLNANAIKFNSVDITDYPRKSQNNEFTSFSNTFGRNGSDGYVILVRGTPIHPGTIEFRTSDDVRRAYMGWSTGQGHIQLVTENGWGLHISANPLLIQGAITAPTIATSTSTTLAAGQVHAITSNATLPNMTTGQWVGVVNNSASPITITKNASDTMYWTALGSSVTSVTVSARGKAIFFCADGTNVYASGNITGSS